MESGAAVWVRESGAAQWVPGFVISKVSDYASGVGDGADRWVDRNVINGLLAPSTEMAQVPSGETHYDLEIELVRGDKAHFR